MLTLQYVGENAASPPTGMDNRPGGDSCCRGRLSAPERFASWLALSEAVPEVRTGAGAVGLAGEVAGLSAHVAILRDVVTVGSSNASADSAHGYPTPHM